jgi:hypothetical protein
LNIPYVRQPIREEQLRQGRLAVEAKLEEAEQSGEPVPVTAKTWKDSEKRVAERLKAAPPSKSACAIRL